MFKSANTRITIFDIYLEFIWVIIYMNVYILIFYKHMFERLILVFFITHAEGKYCILNYLSVYAILAELKLVSFKS
jgi:hypothetical protein